MRENSQRKSGSLTVPAKMAKATEKRKRVTLTIEKKLEIISKIEKGATMATIADKYKIGKSTVSDIKRNQEKIKRFATEAKDAGSLKQRCIVRKADDEDFDKAMHLWFTQERAKGTPISGGIVKEKARLMYEAMYPDREEGHFKASDGWLHRFKERHGIRQLSLQGKILRVNTESAADFKDEEPVLTDEGQRLALTVEEEEEWLNADQNEAGHPILTDEEIIQQVTAVTNSDNDDTDDEEDDEGKISHADAAESLAISYNWLQQQEEATPMNLLMLRELHSLAAKKKELHFCTPLSSSMMQKGVCLRQDTETTLPELTEQHRTRQKEEELSGMESVHMAESETVCAAPGLNTLEPEGVTAHSGVSDVHHTHASLIKTETDLGSTHSGNFIKTESLDSTELGYVTHLHPDQIKTEADNEGFHYPEHIGVLPDFKRVNIKIESSERLRSDLMNTGVDHKDQTGPWQYAGEPSPNCKKEEAHDLLTQCEELNHDCDINNENSRIVQKSANSSRKHINSQRTNVKIEPIINSSKNPSLFQKSIEHRVEGGFNTDGKPYSCSQCEKCFTTKSILNIHQRIHTGEKPYTCTQCEKRFTYKSDLTIHLRIHTGEKPYSCTHCEKCFTAKSDLSTHLRIHTGKKPYKCIHCGRCFSQISHLKRHQQIHTGETPYNCSQCKKGFTYKSALNIHLRIHTGNKPYKCILCGKCFSQKSSLKSHQKTHTGEKPYQCTHCGKCFSRIDNLKYHLRIHTGEKPYSCTQCEKCFTSKTELNKHQRIHTGEKHNRCTH